MSLVRGICTVLLGCLMCACSSSGEPALETAEHEQREEATARAGRTLVVGQAPPGAFVRLETVFAQDFPSPAGEAFIDQSGQMFEPGAVAVQTGQSIQFRSSEDILHNVRVIRADDRVPIFNVATPPWGSYTHKFDQAGTYDVTCDIHTAMRATILVAETPYVTIADDNGRFQFDGVMPGSYTLIGFSGEHELRRVVRISGTRANVTVP